MNTNDTSELLIIINGTVGVGKTSIAKCLADEIENALSIEGDSLGFAPPDHTDESFQNDYGLKVGIDLISKFRKNGTKVIIFDRFFENPKKLDWFISQVGLKCHVFYLLANEEELSNRIRKRARQRAESEILDSKRVHRNQESMKNRGVEIDTNGKSPAVVTKEIMKLIFAD